MEGGEEGLTASPPSEQEKEEWVAEWLEELCPYYMLRDVSYDEFWHGDYTAFPAYLRLYDLKRQKKSEELWLQGLYNFHALSTALSNLNLDGKRRRPNRYLEEPLRIVPYTEAEKKANAERERKKLIDYLNGIKAKSGG